MTTRSGRAIKAPERLIAKDDDKKMTLWRSLDLSENPNIPPRPQPQPQPQAPKAPRAPRAPRPPQPPPDPEMRSLNLDISDVPRSDNIVFSKDFGEKDHPFWQDFYTPKDDITDRYMKVVDKLGDFLPANFALYKEEATTFGVANLELKQEFIKDIKKIPLFSNLVKKEYETAQSKSDKNISASVKFFYNNLPSFKKYKTVDAIDWVVKEHRLLTVEILEYYAKKEKTSLATIKSRFNAITRIFRIAYETKNYQLYTKYSGLVIFLGAQFEDDEFNNELSDLELKKFITFDVVLNKQRQLQQQFEGMQNKLTTTAYDVNQDLLLISLYSLIPPLRGEVKTLKFAKTPQRAGDWIVIQNDGEVKLDLNEEKKRHMAIVFRLSEETPKLAKILKESYELYPREFVFTRYHKYPDMTLQASVSALDDRLKGLFTDTGKSVSVNSLRSSYVSFMNSEAIKNGKQLSVKQKENIALKMRTSRKYLDEAYLKIFPIAREEIGQERPPAPPVQPINEESAYEKQLNRNQRYYEENKEKVLKKQKEYKDSKSAFDKSRSKQLYYLNSDAEYYKKMKPATQ